MSQSGCAGWEMRKYTTAHIASIEASEKHEKLNCCAALFTAFAGILSGEENVVTINALFDFCGQRGRVEGQMVPYCGGQKKWGTDKAERDSRKTKDLNVIWESLGDVTYVGNFWEAEPEKNAQQGTEKLCGFSTTSIIPNCNCSPKIWAYLVRRCGDLDNEDRVERRRPMQRPKFDGRGWEDGFDFHGKVTW
ncbi:hypothetical protein GPALN_006087 [Globodera pallida]|nr:hypothetical protein GPALN_006087 [Globodera pallida]